jgi:Zn-finger nucleic acid-binding protein
VKNALRCPNCDARLVEIERSDVLIDACPQCRGVWLDRGELDKILVKERQLSAADPDEDFYREMEGRRPEPRRAPEPRHDDRRYDDKHYKKKRRRSFLEDLLDFD